MVKLIQKMAKNRQQKVHLTKPLIRPKRVKMKIQSKDDHGSPRNPTKTTKPLIHPKFNPTKKTTQQNPTIRPSNPAKKTIKPPIRFQNPAKKTIKPPIRPPNQNARRVERELYFPRFCPCHTQQKVQGSWFLGFARMVFRVKNCQFGLRSSTKPLRPQNSAKKTIKSPIWPSYPAKKTNPIRTPNDQTSKTDDSAFK